MGVRQRSKEPHSSSLDDFTYMISSKKSRAAFGPKLNRSNCSTKADETSVEHPNNLTYQFFEREMLSVSLAEPEESSTELPDPPQQLRVCDRARENLHIVPSTHPDNSAYSTSKKLQRFLNLIRNHSTK